MSEVRLPGVGQRPGSDPSSHTGEDGTVGAPVSDASTSDPDVQRAVGFILTSTRRRPQTAAEIDAKLSARGFDDDVRAAAIARAERVGAIDDRAFARAWVHDRGERRGYGVSRLAEELARRRVPDDVAQDALAQLEDRDELAVATELARGRVARLPGALDAEAVARRLVGFLVRRGYAPGLARRVAVTVSGLDREWD
jgi:regulatory protein